MNFSKRSKFLLFILLVLLNLVIRVPSIPHESGADSFYVHTLATSISEFGYAKWWINTLSVAGFYPYSECSAVPFILSGISQCTGIDIELVVLLFSIILGFLSIFTMYLLAGLIIKDDFFKMVVAFSYSLTPGILTFSTWNLSTRGPYLVLLPLFIFLLLKTRELKIRATCLGIFMLLFLSTVHHFIFFTIPIIISYFVVIILYKNTKILHKMPDIIYIITFICAFSMPFFTRMFIEHSRYVQLQNIIVTNIRYTGVLLIFAIGGFVHFSMRKNKSFEQWFLLISLLFFAPLMWVKIYAYWFVIIYACLLIGIGLSNLEKVSRINKKYVHATLIIVLCLSISMSGFYQHWRTGIGKSDDVSQWYMDESSYSGALWTKEYIGINERLVGTDNLIDRRMFAISGVPTLLDDSDVHMLVYGFAKIEDTPIVKRSPFSTDFYFGNPYEIDPNYTRVGYIRNHLMHNDIDSNTAKNIITQFNLSYVVENKEGITDVFIRSVHKQKSNIYDNGKISIWDLSR
ncbi:MAG: hypothetical protein JG777_1762 [Clostridia bacterium]|jgi:hypothetical protein|nr:hypothetical protein [Clostridia bacterium]